MKILVTGGAGFIGSHLCERLLGEGHEVVVVDELNDFYAPALKQENLSLLRRRGLRSFYRQDIRDEQAMHGIVSDHRPDTIVHLAARAGVRPSLLEPLLYESVNVRGTMILLEAARLAGVRKFVFASSSSIYGASDVVPFREDAGVQLPVSPYAATKIAGEKICHTWSHLYGLSCVCLRFFTVYGPRQRPDLAIRKFAGLIAADLPVPMFGDGASGRDYTFVEDTVEGIRSAMDYECKFDVFNLGNSSPVSLRMMIQTIGDVLGKTPRIEQHPDQPGDVPITYADIGKAQRLLGYAPRTPFAEGIRRFIAWHESQREAVATAG